MYIWCSPDYPSISFMTIATMFKNINGTERRKARNWIEFYLNWTPWCTSVHDLLFATVRILRTKFNSCAFVVGSPNVWAALFAPQPTGKILDWALVLVFPIIDANIAIRNGQNASASLATSNRRKILPLARNLSSCRMQTAFKHSIHASIKDHSVNILIWSKFLRVLYPGIPICILRVIWLICQYLLGFWPRVDVSHSTIAIFEFRIS